MTGGRRHDGTGDVRRRTTDSSGTVPLEPSSDGGAVSDSRSAALEAFLDSLSLAFDRAPIGLAVVGAEPSTLGRYLRVNAAFCRLTGYSDEELAETSFLSITHPEDRERGTETVRSLLRGEERTFELEKRYLKRDGSVLWVLLSGVLIAGPAGDPLCFFTQFHDITERKRAEDALRHREHQLVEAQELSRTGSWEWDLGSGTLRWSENLYRIAGLEPRADEQTVERFFELVHGDDLPAVRRSMEELREGRAPGDLEFRVVRPDGGLRWLHGRARVERDPAGAPVLVRGTVADVTERVRAEQELRSSDEAARLVIETASDAFVAVDDLGIITRWNRQAETMFGWSAAEAIGRELAEVMVPSRYQEAHRRGLERFRATGQAPIVGRRLELAAVHRDGHEIPVEISVWRSPAGGTFAWNAFLRDISERKRAEELLHADREFLDAVLDSLHDGIMACDADGVITLFNQVMRELHGMPEHPVPADRWAEHFDIIGADGVLLAKEDLPLYRALSGEELRNAEFELSERNGQRHTFVCNGRAMYDAAGRKLGAVVALHEVTAQREAEARLVELSLCDELTGLANRALLLDRVEQALERGAGTGHARAVVYMNLDRFSSLNESLGRSGADRVLKMLATRLRDAVGPQDTVARPGGDEFAVLCEDVRDAGEALELARRLAATMAAPVPAGSEDVSVTVSTGVAIVEDASDPAEVVGDAEVAMRRAKALGPGRCEVFSPGMRSGVRERLENERALRHAMETGQLFLVYQPKFSLESDGIVGAEALLRWQHPERGLIPPLQFVPLAEETGLIVPIGTWVVEEACRQAAAWRQQYPDRPPFVVAVNVSARQFGSGLIEVVRRALEESGAEPASLCLEVTESMVMDDVAAAVAILAALKELGVTVAVDDFGTGYSSLSYLRRLPLDTLKIDRSFISGLGSDSEDTAIVAAVMGMAHALELSVVAEGVETDEALAKLRGLGCEYAQGYYFGRPQEAEAVSRLLDTEIADRATRDVASGHRSDTVLIVDDSPEVLHLAHMSLTAAGFEVHEATSGDEALARAIELYPECVVLDVQMPGMTGFEVCAALRANPELAHCTIVMLTATALAADKVKAFSLGADDYMVKPFSPRDLVSRVRAAQRRRSASVG